GNGEYQPGQGLAGVTITVAGVGSTTTMDAGGYAIPLAPGTYTVTASGGGLATPIARTVVVGDDNVRLDFDADPNGFLVDAAPTGAASGVLGTFKAIAAGDTAASYSARVDWGDGNATFATLSANPDGTFNVQGSNTYAGPGVYAVRVLITHLSDGQTIAINAAVVVNTSSYSGPTFPNPYYPGLGSSEQGSVSQGGNGQASPGAGTTTTGHGRHHKKHPKAPHPTGHLPHAVGKHPTGRRPGQKASSAHRTHIGPVAFAPLIATVPVVVPRSL